MIDRLRRLLTHPDHTRADRAGLAAVDQMRHDLKQGRRGRMPLADLRPVLIPTPILTHGQWVGPYHVFAKLPISLTWAFLRPHGTMLYLSYDAAATFEQQGVDWRRNARQASAHEFQTRPWSHAFKGAAGKVEAVALLHDDGLGPSRLLHAQRLLDLFPSGYRWFVPERSVALVLSQVASTDVSSKVLTMVEKSFGHADIPMSKQAFSHESLIEALAGAGEVSA